MERGGHDVNVMSQRLALGARSGVGIIHFPSFTRQPHLHQDLHPLLRSTVLRVFSFGKQPKEPGHGFHFLSSSQASLISPVSCLVPFPGIRKSCERVPVLKSSPECLFSWCNCLGIVLSLPSCYSIGFTNQTLRYPWVRQFI